MLTNEGVESHVEATELLGLQHRLFPGVGHPPCTHLREREERNVPQRSAGVRWLDPLLGVGDDRQVRVSTTQAMAPTRRVAGAVVPLRLLLGDGLPIRPGRGATLTPRSETRKINPVACERSGMSLERA